MIRAANTGISTVIDAHGRMVGNLGLNRQGVLDLPVPGPLPPTFFARFGLFVPGWLAAACALASLVAEFVNARMYKKEDYTCEKRKVC